MSGQNTLITLATEEEAENPETKFTTQGYQDSEHGLLTGKSSIGEVDRLSLKGPDSVGRTTNADPTEIFINTVFTKLPSRIKIKENTSAFYSYFVQATREGGPAAGARGASGIAQLQFLVKNVDGVTTIVVSSGPINLTTGDAEAAAWSTDATIGGVNNDEIILTVTGEAGKTIKWDARMAVLAELKFT